MTQTLSQLPPTVLIAAYAVFWGWEATAGARRPLGEGHRRVRNLLLTVVTFVIAGLGGAALMVLAAWARAHHIGLFSQVAAPEWVSVIAGLLALDVADYWRHRLSHEAPLLWRLHRMHHTDPAIDVTTTFRNHPVEMLIRPLFLAVGVVAVGAPPLALIILPLLQLPVLVFQHANIRLPAAADRLLSVFIVTPGMHLVHHSRDRMDTNSNYSTWLSLWDGLFRTRRPTRTPAAIGLDGYDQPLTLAAMLLSPLR